MSNPLDDRFGARVRATAATLAGAAGVANMSRRDLRATLQKVADLAVIRPAQYLVRRLGFRPDVITAVKRLAAEESARYVLDQMMPCAVFDDRYALLDLAVRNIAPTGHLLEFGVFNGRSINYVAKQVSDRSITGFDSFEGLAEDWGGTGLLRGAFNVGGKLPRTERNVTLVKGWFNATVPPFLAEHPGPIAFAHLDADTYESTRYVLEQIADRLVVGTVLQFDEYLGYPGWQKGEHLAFANLCKTRGIRYKYLGVGWMSVALQILDAGSAPRT